MWFEIMVGILPANAGDETGLLGHGVVSGLATAVFHPACVPRSMVGPQKGLDKTE